MQLYLGACRAAYPNAQQRESSDPDGHCGPDEVVAWSLRLTVSVVSRTEEVKFCVMHDTYPHITYLTSNVYVWRHRVRQ